jgi:hypothetical protein
VVAIVAMVDGEVLRTPRPHGTAQGYPRIKAALGSAALASPLNHYLILQLSAYAEQS